MPDCRGLCLCLVWLALAAPAHAQDMSHVKTSIEKNREALQSASRKQDELEAREKKLRKELSGLQQDMVGIAGKIQRQEKTLSELEANLVNLEDEEKAMTTDLNRRQREQSALVRSMLKLSRVPPEMIVAMPGDFEKTMRTAKVLGLTTHAITEQAKALRAQLEEIHALQEQIRQNHKQISRQRDSLEDDQNALEGKLAARGKIQNQLLSRQEEQQKAVKRLSAESSSLRELMSQLESRHKKQAEKAAKLAMVPEFKPDRPEKPAPAPRKSRGSSKPFATKKGKIALPAEGKIFIFYGDKTKDGDDSRGIRIRTRAGAQVTAPFAGEVVYTGDFLDYGNMVIIRHENDYHSLLAGMARITAKLGQQLIEGEPIGEMGRNVSQTALYMEIRESNRPIDPMPWLEDQRIALSQ